MAENKKSFVLYADIIYTVGKLSDEQAGKLFKHLLDYVNDRNPETDDLIIQLAFEPIRQQLKRDLEKWESIREKRAEAGRISAEKRAKTNKKKQKATNSTSVESVQQTSTNSTVNVNDNVNVNVNVINDNIYKSFAHLSITREECNKLFYMGYTQTQIEEVLEQIENFAGNKKYKSLYLTAKNWLKREFGDKKQLTKKERYEQKLRDAARF